MGTDHRPRPIYSQPPEDQRRTPSLPKSRGGRLARSVGRPYHGDAGGIIVTSTGNFGSVELTVQAETFGGPAQAGPSIDTSGYDNAVQTYLYRSRQRSTVGGSKGAGLGMFLQWADRMRFDGAIDVLGYSRIQNSRINDDFTTVSAANAGIRPDGIVATEFTGAHDWNGPASSLRLDSYSNYSIINSAWTIQAPATKVVLGDLTP